MAIQGRTEKVVKNSATNVIGQGLQIALQFITRTVFIYVLGKEYLGISSLFTNILTVLSVTELGLGSAIAFCLYKPLANNDERKIRAFMQLYRRAYLFIGLAVCIIGIALLPALPYLMKDTTDLVDVRLYYLLYLAQSVSSYWFFAYKITLLNADQKQYVFNLINYSAMIISSIVRIIILVVFKSFFWYTVCGIGTQIMSNYMVSLKVDKLYPYLKGPKEAISKEDKTTLIKNVFSTSLYKINSVIVSTIDNLLISAYISVVAVGLYGNYSLIVSSLMSIIKIVFQGMGASVGNMYQIESKEQNEKTFRAVSFLVYWIFGWCGICLAVLLNPFIKIWIGEDYLFSKITVLIIVFNFVTQGFQQPAIIYKDACGLFWQGKFRPLATAITNLIFSLILAPKYGITGIVIGTIISRFITVWWFEPKLVYKHAFKMSSKSFFVNYFIAVGVLVSLYVATEFLCSHVPGDQLMSFVAKMFVCAVFPNVIVYFLFRRTYEFRFFVGHISSIINKFKRK